jgi:hypothetical protein
MIPLLDRDDDDDLAAYTGQPPTPLAINTPPMMRGISPFAPRTPPPSPATSLDGYPRIWTPSPRLEALRRLSITTDATVPSMTRDASSDDVSVTWDTDTSTVHDVGLGINDEFEIEVHGIEYEDDCGVQHIEFIKDPVQLPEPSQGPLRPRPDMSRPFRRAPQPVHAMRPMASRQNSPRPRTRRSLGFRQSRSSSEPTSPRQTPSMQRRLSRRSPQSPASSFDSFLDMASDNEDNVFSRSAAFTVNLAKRISEEHRAHRLRRTAKNIMHTVLGGGRVRKTRVAFQCPGAGAPGLV